MRTKRADCGSSVSLKLPIDRRVYAADVVDLVKLGVPRQRCAARHRATNSREDVPVGAIQPSAENLTAAYSSRSDDQPTVDDTIE
jgi:hypothetical protein